MERQSPNQERLINDILGSVDADHIVQFDGHQVHLYEYFDPMLIPAQDDPNVQLISYHLHMPSTDEPLRVQTYQQMRDVPVTPLKEWREKNAGAVYNAAGEIEGNFNDASYSHPFTGDVESLTEQRVAQGELFMQELRDYAAHVISTRSESYLNERIPCPSCHGARPDCVDCGGVGSEPKYPTILLTNQDTGDILPITVDVAKWIADGELTIDWRPDDFWVGRNGFYIDFSGFIASKAKEIGVDYEHALEAEEPLFVRPTYARYFDAPIDERQFIPDALSAMEEWVIGHTYVPRTQSGRHFAFRATRSTASLLTALRAKAELYGQTIAYTRKIDRETRWQPRHSFMVMSKDGMQTQELVEADYLMDYEVETFDEDINSSLERALYAITQLTDAYEKEISEGLPPEDSDEL